MVYTVTFNPSLDYIVAVDDFKLGKTNRTVSESMLPGGKGLNVSIVLSDFGIDNTAVFFSAGFVGKEIKGIIEHYGIKTNIIDIPEGNSRINFKLSSIDGTEINGMGPNIPDDKLEELYEIVDGFVDGDTVILAGSIPKTLPDTIYSDILQRVAGKDIKVIVDATGELLTNVLKYKPFLIKPNNFELQDLFGVELKTRESVIPYAIELQKMGAVNVLVSLAEDGAVLLAENGKIYSAPAPQGEVINAVGAGDSVVAAFIAASMEKPGDYEYAFKMGLAAGSASAFSVNLATKEEVVKIYKTI